MLPMTRTLPFSMRRTKKRNRLEAEAGEIANLIKVETLQQKKENHQRETIVRNKRSWKPPGGEIGRGRTKIKNRKKEEPRVGAIGAIERDRIREHREEAIGIRV